MWLRLWGPRERCLWAFSCCLAERLLLELSQIVHVQVAVRLEPVLVPFDAGRRDQPQTALEPIPALEELFRLLPKVLVALGAEARQSRLKFCPVSARSVIQLLRGRRLGLLRFYVYRK